MSNKSKYSINEKQEMKNDAIQRYLALPDASVASKGSQQVKCMPCYLLNSFDNKLFNVEACLGPSS